MPAGARWSWRSRNGAGTPVAALADLVLDTEVGPELCPSTMTFAGSLVALAAVTGILGGGVAEAVIAEVADAAAEAAAAAAALLERPRRDRGPPRGVARRTPDDRRARPRDRARRRGDDRPDADGGGRRPGRGAADRRVPARPAGDRRPRRRGGPVRPGAVDGRRWTARSPGSSPRPARPSSWSVLPGPAPRGVESIAVPGTRGILSRGGGPRPSPAPRPAAGPCSRAGGPRASRMLRR